MDNQSLPDNGKIEWAHDEILLPTAIDEGVGQFAYSYLEALREIAEQLKRVADSNEPKVINIMPKDTVFEADTKVGDVITDGKKLTRIKSIGEHGRYLTFKDFAWWEVIAYRFKKWWNR